MRDHRRRVELSGAEELRHLDPRVVHPPADDAVDRDPLEDDLRREVHLHRLRRDAEHLHSAADAHERERLVDRRSARPTSRARRPRRARRSPRFTARLGLLRGARRRARPSCCASASRVWFTSLAMIRDAPAAWQIPTAKMPIGPHPVTSTVLPGSSVPVERGVERVAHRVVDAADLVRDRRRRGARRSSPASRCSRRSSRRGRRR